MVMKLDKVVPFGRALDEYQGMFSLTADDLNKRISGSPMARQVLMPR